MIAIKLIFGIVCCIGCFGCLDASIGQTGSQSLSSPDKTEYRATVTGSDKHKFGYELEENKHFHHTTTDEDGVRLGCYGHVLESKKYSTQYVADMKGYRTVPTHDLITVFPKSGGERKASFIRQFSEDEAMSHNIRFFFPDGCQAKQPDLEVSQSRIAPVYERPPPVTTRRTTTTTETPTTEAYDACPPPKCVCTCS